jgi:hypothetical protein
MIMRWLYVVGVATMSLIGAPFDGGARAARVTEPGQNLCDASALSTWRPGDGSTPEVDPIGRTTRKLG